jgi:tol-pal system protein YbgF
MKISLKATSAAVMAALFVGVPMSAHALEDTDARRAILELRKQIADLSARVDNKLDPVVAQLSSKADTKNLIDLAGELERLRNEIAGLRGQLEVVTNEIANGQRRQRDFYIDLDQRLRVFEQKHGAADGKSSDSKSAEQKAAVAEQKAAEQKALDAALAKFKSGDYRSASESLSTFLQRYPDSGLSALAWFWLGNSHFAMLDCPSAIRAYQTVVSRYANSPRVPDAMLNLASCQLDMNDKAAARDILSSLIKKFPNSPAAASARERLSELR